MKVRDVISQLRVLVKANNKDAFLSDRMLWSLITKHTDSVIFKYRHSTNIISSPDLYVTVYGLELEETSLLEKSCIFVDDCLDIKIYKSKDKLPDIRVINGKLLIQSVTSVDFGYKLVQISFGNYVNILRNRYKRFATNKYYAIDGGFLYVFDVNGTRDAIKKVNITAAFKDAVSANMVGCGCSDDGYCVPSQDLDAGVPSMLLSEIISLCINDISVMLNINMVSDDNDMKHPLNSQ